MKTPAGDNDQELRKLYSHPFFLYRIHAKALTLCFQWSKYSLNLVYLHFREAKPRANDGLMLSKLEVARMKTDSPLSERFNRMLWCYLAMSINTYSAG